MAKGYRLMALAAVLLVFAGCKSADDYREERIQKAGEHMDKINKRVLPSDVVLSLPQCIDLALKNNLDLQVNELREKISKERVTAEMLGMLPDLIVSDDYTARSNVPGSSSKSLGAGGATYNFSQSSDQDINNVKIEMALSLLDFGLAYLNAAQAEDRSLIETEQSRRAAQNLTLEIVRTYFKVAATQDAIETTEALLAKCRDLEKTFKELEKSKAISPFILIDERKRFIRLQQRLMEYRRNYQNACIELRSLMGFLPVSSIRVDTAALRAVVELDIPDILLMEKIALVERPELYQLDIQTNITTNEARKTILTMLPNVKMFVDFTNSNNTFLYHQSWWEIGVRAAYNLLKLPQQIARFRALDSEVDEIAMRTLALSVGVMSQVRIAHANIIEMRERYSLDEKIYTTYKQHLELATKSLSSGGAQSALELDRLRMETAETQIQRTLSLGNYYVAYYRLLNAVGMSSFDKATVGRIVEEIKLAEAREKARNERATRSIARLQNDFRDNVASFNGVTLGQNTLSEDRRNKLEALIPKSNKKAGETKKAL